MQVETLPLAALTAYEANPKTHPKEQIDLLKRSIAEFGWTVPVLVDRSNVVIAGHGRLEAALQLGMTEVPAIRLDDLTEAQARAYRLLDNRAVEMGAWDDSLLTAELDFLRTSEFDLELTGFDLGEIGRLMAPPGEDPPAPEPPADPITEPGDLWTLGRHRLLCGDSTDAETVARLLDGAKPNLMVTDPPFGVNFDPQWRAEAAESGRIKYGAPKRTSYMAAGDDTTIDWREVWRIAPSEVAYIYLGHAGVVAQAITLEDLGWELRRLIVWVKQSPVITRGPYGSQSEHVWYAVRKGARADWIGPASTSDVWSVNWEGGTTHGAQKPIECMARPIRHHRGDVYEPFAGSGTTLIAAGNLDRTCYAVEISPAYCDVIVERWQNHTGGQAVREAA